MTHIEWREDATYGVSRSLVIRHAAKEGMCVLSGCRTNKLFTRIARPNTHEDKLCDL